MDVVGGGFVRIKLGFYMLDSVMEQFYEGEYETGEETTEILAAFR